MYVKIHHAGQHTASINVVAVCDESLLGKTLQEGKISITISESFYKGDLKNEKETLAVLKDARNINLIGEEAVATGLKAGIITKENIRTIKGVSHAQAVVF